MAKTAAFLQNELDQGAGLKARRFSRELVDINEQIKLGRGDLDLYNTILKNYNQLIQLTKQQAIDEKLAKEQAAQRAAAAAAASYAKELEKLNQERDKFIQQNLTQRLADSAISDQAILQKAQGGCTEGSQPV